MDDISFRDWRRTEELNRDITEGYLDNGKRCVHTFPWQEDPAIEEQGSWFQSSCATPRAFVCQHAANTHNILLRVTGKSVFVGGAEVYGGSLQLWSADILGLKVSHASEIIVAPNSSDVLNELRTVHLVDGSILRLEGPGKYNVRGSAFIGERTLAGQQPLLMLGPEVNLAILTDSEAGNAVISARVVSNQGNVLVGPGAMLDLRQVNRSLSCGFSFLFPFSFSLIFSQLALTASSSLASTSL